MGLGKSRDPASVCQEASAIVAQYMASADAPKDTKTKVTKSLEIIDEILSQYPTEELALSFNGGKDCQIMLILILAQLYRRTQTPAAELNAIHVRVGDSFPSLDKFVEKCAETYDLDLVTATQPMKEALELYLSSHPRVKAIFVGIRRQDPYGQHLEYVQRTDHGWPDFVRVHPVLEWDYGDVWSFLRLGHVPYCPLYDEGYTSLGGVTTTTRNPALKLGEEKYEPAYKLRDYDQERVGRFQTPQGSR